ncbi:E1 ubiquitin-activating protein AOS1 KNAG_0F03910 [Huiozyma naganishii CBS 8797]|uniref:Ubiquitin-like 1-activating enzyme E1A n=1 Tax=Huiozyma naganishii (strain ATCC MYA-139 / BCRC 22969 / CBS 8797 / KCTC 17520 / NBRC 10181 / NCYC 3082 / Yp74L-3) TaxID=1071383 RepID=J7R872_HUIN7|nr:hypothetical protein KNAG_0F03910 [Kazachstania naganishii CBS 8797]CCK71055.1 hypothetical protein KNAG_0F03910 [Kazachstania naganishii CBS 8797]
MLDSGANTGGNLLSADEIALYDRQIRLWGLAAQANMRSAKVLLAGCGAIGTEITKNIVLSGIGHLCICDGHVVTEEDLGSQFFLARDSVGLKRIAAVRERVVELNPRVALSFEDIFVDTMDEEFLAKFDLVIGTELGEQQISHLNKLTRKLNIPLYVAGSNGLFGYIFVDLIQFDGTNEKLQSAKPTVTGSVSANREIIKVEVHTDDDDDKKTFETIMTRNKYRPFDEMLLNATLKGQLKRRQLKRVSNVLPLTLTQLQNSKLLHENAEKFTENVRTMCDQLGIDQGTLSQEYISQFINQAGLEFAPVAAVIGGVLAQDVVNILGKRQLPLNNFIIFDGITLDMPIFEL